MSTAPAKPHLVLGLDCAGALMTPKEFDAVEDYDENYRYELIHGVLVVAALPLAEETDPNEELGHWLRSYQEQHPRGKVLDATLPQQYVYLRTSRRIADRLIWTGLGRQPNRRTDLPTIAVEFVSQSRRDWQRDYVHKKREYMKLGIREYWIIDRFRRTLTVVRNKEGKPDEVVIPESAIYRPELLPGFKLPLATLLAVADRWADG